MRVMSEHDIRKELIGPPMTGTYASGSPWDETYFKDGHIVYRDEKNNWVGKWSFRGRRFCTFYNQGVNGGCWYVLKTSDNCYEFYSAFRPFPSDKGGSPGRTSWVARGWRTSRPSTCDVEVGV